MATYLLDTCVFSEWAKRKEPVLSNVLSHRAEGIVLSIVTIGEVFWGCHNTVRKPSCPLKKLVHVYSAMALAVEIFNETTILPFTSRSLEIYQRLRTGRGNRSVSDLQIAAIALEHGLILVTSNTRDFEDVPDLQLVNWAAD